MRAPLSLALALVLAPVAGCLEDGDGAAGGNGTADDSLDGDGEALDAKDEDADVGGEPSSGNVWCAHLASWTEPGLYAALPQANTSFEQQEPRGRPLPFPEDAGPDGGALTRVSWRVIEDGRPTGDYFLAWYAPDHPDAATPTIGALAPAERTDEELRPLFDAFARGLTSADEATLDAWFHDFTATKRPGALSKRPGEPEKVESYDYHVNVSGEALDLASWWGAADAGKAERESFGVVERWTWTRADGEWEWEFELTMRSTILLTEEAPMGLRVSGNDRVQLHSAEFQDERSDDELRAWVAGAFADAGLPEPTFEEWERGGSIC